VVGSQIALYKRFRIKIWDMFDNFDPNLLKLKLRASAFNLEFIVPSQGSFEITVNIPPSNS